MAFKNDEQNNAQNSWQERLESDWPRLRDMLTGLLKI